MTPAPLGLTCYVALQDTSLNMLFAGHDTSASAIMLAMRHLKLQPHLLHKLRQEQQQVCGTTFSIATVSCTMLILDQSVLILYQYYAGAIPITQVPKALSPVSKRVCNAPFEAAAPPSAQACSARNSSRFVTLLVHCHFRVYQSPSVP